MSFQPEKRMFVVGGKQPSKLPFRLAPLAGAVLGSLLLLQSANAAVTYEFTPRLSVAAVHDDNLFLTPEPTIDDRITRVTAGAQLDVVGDSVNLTASYSQDAEYYKDHSELDSTSLRRTGAAEVTFRATERLSWGLEGSYFKTPQPGDLNLGIGIVQFGRVPTTQRMLGGSVDYAVSPTLDTSFRYGVTRDETELGIGGDTNEAGMDFEKALSARNTLLFGYTYRNFEFTNDTQQETHTLMAGVDHRFSATTSGRLLVGPRVYDDSVEPNIEASLTHEFLTGEMRATYSRSETLLAGTDIRVESQIANLVFTRRFGQNLEFSLLPAWGSVESPFGTEADVVQLGADVTYHFNDYISVSAAAQLSRQSEDIAGGLDRDVPRDVYLVSLNFTWPIRGARP
jgi:hypothetical protein